MARRFILVQCHPSENWGVPQWRATSATEDSTIDVFFFASDVEAARAHVRSRYQDVTFSDEVDHGL